jgi:hypothetical protein
MSWPLAPAIHPVSSGSRGWGCVGKLDGKFIYYMVEISDPHLGLKSSPVFHPLVK